MEDEKKDMKQLIRELSEVKKAESINSRLNDISAEELEQLLLSQQKTTTLNLINQIFLTVPDEAIYGEVLNVVLQVMKSRFGIFGYISENGDLVVPSLTRDIWNECQVLDKSVVFPSDGWGQSLWGKAIRGKKTFRSDGPFHKPEGHIEIKNFLTVPVIFGEDVIGLISVANKANGYTDNDEEILEEIVRHISPILRARLQRDIQERERRQAEEALRKSDEKFKLLVENSRDLIYTTDGKGYLTYVNMSLSKILGYENGELEGKPFTKIVSAECFEKVRDIFKRARKYENIPVYEVDLVSKDGRKIPVEFNPSTLYDFKGDFTGRFGIGRDITKRKQVEEALRESEEKYRNIFENAVEGIFQSTPDGKFLRVNPAMAHMCGYSSPEEMISSITDIGSQFYVHPEERKIFMKNLEEYGVDKNFEHQVYRKNSSILWISTNSRTVRDVSGNIVYYEGTHVDITERKQAEEALRVSNERFRALSENISIIIYSMDLAGAITYVNQSWSRILGYSREEILGHYFIEFAREEDKETYRKLFKGIRDENKTVSNHIGIVLTKEGRERIFNMNSDFILDSAGRITGVVGSMQDITELIDIEKKLVQAQKMEAIGTLAGGIAHDFNNLLMGIQGYASLILMDVDPLSKNYDRLKRIEEQVKSGTDLTMQLLGLARGGKYEVKPTDMNDIVDKTSSTFGRTKKEITINTKYAQDPWIVEVDRGQMEQVLMNLYVNAWQAMPGGGEIYLETENVVLGEEQTLPYSVKPGRYVKIEVTDTGMGMDERTKERIFDPFFTTKAKGRGTGLGLATVYGIVKGHKGIIHVDSELGHGAVFTIYIPASGKEVLREREESKEVMKGGETILLVDDEKMIIEVTKELLESLGYRVYIAVSGQEAIALYKEKRGEISLVILDMIMPGLSGGETFDQLRGVNPEIKTLLSSGYSIDGQAQDILNRGCNGFLQKPFQLEQLSRKIREILD